MAEQVDFPLFKRICETPGAPGYESRIRELVLEQVRPLVDEVQVDNMGNVIALRKGRENKKVMAAAHMDEISFIVRFVDEQGFLHFQALGGFDPKTLTAQRVLVHTREGDLVGVMGTKAIHIMTEEERKKNPQLSDYFIDLGMTKEEVDQKVRIGDPITREREIIEMGHCINGKSIDNRVAVYILIETLRRLTETPDYDFYACFTVQEEVGLRGASVAAQIVDPDFGIGIDTTVANDVSASTPKDYITQLGEGTAIKVMDSSTICDPRMIDFMRDTAEARGIQYQMELLTAGGTDTGGLQRRGRQGSIAGAVSIPTRYLHQVIETAHKEDIMASVNLLHSCMSRFKDFDWSAR
jgi:endoglucanase